MQSDRLDAAIDEVAAAMAAGEPSHAFRTDVMSRLPERHAGPRRWRSAFVLAPVAAAALVLVFVARSGRDSNHAGRVATALASAATDHRLPAVEQDSTRVAERQPATGSQIVNNEVRSKVVRSRMAAGPVATAFERLELAPVDSAALSTDAIPTTAIGTDRLDIIPPLAIAPLAADDGQRRER